MEGRAIKKGPVTPLVRGRARRPYANRDQGLCPRCGAPPPMPAVCTGAVTASLSQPDAPKIDRGRPGERQLGVVRASACARLDVRPLLIAVETHSGGRPARSGYPSRPPALAVRPPVALRLQGTSSRQDCTADMWAAVSGGGVRAPVHGRHKPCREWCRRGWLQLPLLHQVKSSTASSQVKSSLTLIATSPTIT